MQLRSVTKALVASVTTLTALLQIPDVQQAAKAAVIHHAHLTTCLSGVLVIVSLLHNPAVAKALGLQIQQTTTTATVVPLSSVPNQTSQE